MTKKEAFKKVLRHEEVKPVPFSIKFTVEAKEKMFAKYGPGFNEVTDTGSYVVASHTNNGWQEIKPGYFKDYFGVVWNKTKDRTLGMVDHPPIKEPTLDGFKFPDPENIPVYEFIKRDQIQSGLQSYIILNRTDLLSDNRILGLHHRQHSRQHNQNRN